MDILSFVPLQSLCQGSDLYLANALVTLLREEQRPEVANAFVSVFVQPNSAHFSATISKIIDYEIARCGGQEILVFRDSMSPGAKFLDVLLDQYASKFMKKLLAPFAKKLLKIWPSLEVNPAKVEGAQLKSNIAATIQIAFDVLTKIFGSAKKFPQPIAHIIALLAEKLSAFTSQESASRTAVGTIVMLKLVGPMLCSSTGLQSLMKSSSKSKGVDMIALSKGMITIAKVLQAIANNVSYEPETYMCCFNDFIDQSTPIYMQLIENIVKIGSKTTRIVDDIPIKRQIKDWTAVFNYIAHNKAKLVDKCLALDNISTSVGGVETASGAEMAAELERVIDQLTADKRKAELDNLQVFM